MNPRPTAAIDVQPLIDTLTDLVIAREDWDRTAAIIDRLTPREQRAMLIRTYLTAVDHDESGDIERLERWARSVVTTVHLRLNVPSYRDKVNSLPRRTGGDAIDMEDVLRHLGT